MLVLSRKEGEVLVIGDGPDAIVITVAELLQGRIRIGIEADKEQYPVYRLEVLPKAHPLFSKLNG